MKISHLLLTVAPLALAAPALAETAPVAAANAKDAKVNDGATDSGDATPAAKKAADSDMVTTGVARGRDRLDSATSTSSIKESEIEKFAPRSLGEIFRNIPGVRSLSPGGEGNASISIRGLPLALGGSKFLQLQEDGLPVLEFGDIAFGTPDDFLRADLNLAQVEAIRGGSASTFASNSPGGVINLISKTGDVEGGSVQATTGLDYEIYRLDFDYGAKLSDTLRFHFGGFYRQGEGPRAVGYDAYKGGQLKFNITKDLAGDGYIRVYGKYLDDRTPAYLAVPVKVTGTNDDPKYSNVPGLDASKDTMLSRYFTSNVTLDQNNNVVRDDMTDGMHSIAKSIGVETAFDVAGWSISERFRYSKNSGAFRTNFVANAAPAAALATAFGGPGAVLSYASGPNSGQVIANPSALNGNGLLAMTIAQDTKLNSLDNVTNDLRASRVWDIGNGKLTTTAGFYKASQTIDTAWQWNVVLLDVNGGGNAALVNIRTAGGVPITQDGVLSYGTAGIGGVRRSIYDVKYNVNAPYGSFNYHVGKVAIGASIRYDYGSANGELVGADLGGGRVNTAPFDINGDGVISPTEQRVSVYPLTRPAPVDYDYHYLSYSTGINYHFVEPASVFARYSRGARANADRILFSSYVSPVTGDLASKGDGFDTVKQAEIGGKFRKDGLTLNLTGFWAKTREHNIGLNRSYRAVGAEFEGGYRVGIFSLTAGATYTDAKIVRDALTPALEGNVPKDQAKLIFQATPQIETGRFTVGANFIGTTSSYAQDTNQLKLPGFTQVNAFLQFRATDRVQISLNSNNLFNTKGYIEADQGAIPATGVVTAKAINGRTISSSLKFDF